MGLRCIAVLLAVVSTLMLTNGQNVPRIRPIYYRLPTPPVLKGPLSANSILTNAEKVHEGKVKGPSSFVNQNGVLYAGTADNKIYEMSTCPPRLIASLSPERCRNKYQCGQLLSLRWDPSTSHLVALDTFRGLFAINPQSGKVIQIYSTRTPVNGRRPMHLNDMVIASNGIIVMTDSSDVYDYHNDVYICMDGRPTGRLIAFVPQTGFIGELLPRTFNFPNGIEFTPDGDLLVTEVCRVKVHRISLRRNSWLKVSNFTTNLPGLPDNIRASGRGTYWIAMSYPRHSAIRNPLDRNAVNPRYRSMGFDWATAAQLKAYFVPWAVVVEVNATGSPIGSLHDPTGSTIKMVTEVNEFDGTLNVGSHLNDYMVRVLMPKGTGKPISIDSFIQVKRSRCELKDSEVEATRQRLLQQFQGQNNVIDKSTNAATNPPKAIPN